MSVSTIKPLWLLPACIVAGIVCGIATSAAYQAFSITPQLTALATNLDARLNQIAHSTSTATVNPNPANTNQPITVDPRFVESNEGVTLAQRNEMVGSLRRHSLVKVDDVNANVIGQVVSVTADGWLVAPVSVINAIRLADLYVVIQNQAYEIEKGYKDTSTGLTYLKINAHDLAVASFAPAADISRALLVFAEPTQRWELQTVSSDHVTEDMTPVVSEFANRRFLVTGMSQKNRAGMAIWDRAGRLIGIAERSLEEGWMVIPASYIDASLSSIINGGIIKRASLGVRSQELSTLVAEPGKTNPSNRGAWLRPNHTLPAVTLTGPSAKVLQDGDVIQKIDRDVLDGTADLGEHLLEYRPGSTVTITGLRKGAAFTATVQLSSVTTSEVLK